MFGRTDRVNNSCQFAVAQFANAFYSSGAIAPDSLPLFSTTWAGNTARNSILR